MEGPTQSGVHSVRDHWGSKARFPGGTRRPTSLRGAGGAWTWVPNFPHICGLNLVFCFFVVVFFKDIKRPFRYLQGFYLLLSHCLPVISPPEHCKTDTLRSTKKPFVPTETGGVACGKDPRLSLYPWCIVGRHEQGLELVPWIFGFPNTSLQKGVIISRTYDEVKIA